MPSVFSGPIQDWKNSSWRLWRCRKAASQFWSKGVDQAGLAGHWCLDMKINLSLIYKVWLQILKWDLLKVCSRLHFIWLCPACLIKGIAGFGQAKSISWGTPTSTPDNILCSVSWMTWEPQTHACIQALCCSVLGWACAGCWPPGLPFPPKPWLPQKRKWGVRSE